jgi:2-polyprenyl-3-methyl-5-hydroxy-6-metoxy-1,4-benzoquinol methylase/glycosyltransferase involved in cell wall biosynthesis
MMLGSLYICYFNTEEPLVHTQVLPYLRAVATSGVRIHLLTYERRGRLVRGEHERRRELKERLAADGIRWHALKYHKRPSLPATAFDVAVGILYSAWLLLRHRLTIIHARAHIPGVMGLALQSLLRRKLIFDLRGQMAEEYVDNGVWTRQSFAFRLVKATERALLRRADRIVMLTEKLRRRLLETAAPVISAEKISVIPCCTDLSQYEGARREAKPAGQLTLVYAGSVGGRYLLGEMVEFFKALRGKRPGSHFLLLTHSDHAEAARAFAERGVDATSYSISSVAPADVPARLCDADIAISFIKQSAATDAMSPTKIGEYLAAGLPVISTPGGDTEMVLEPCGVGVIINDLTRDGFDNAVEPLIASFDDPKRDARQRCRDVARQHFSLSEVGSPRYVALYQWLAQEPATNKDTQGAGYYMVDADGDDYEPNAPCPVCRTGASRVVAEAREGVRLRRCSDCGLHFHRGFADTLEAEDYYSSYYHTENLAFSPLTKGRFRSLIASFESYRETGRLLDIGCGAGHFLKVASAQGWGAHGTEIAASAFEHLSRYGIKTFQGELQAARYPADFFDVVYCSEVVEHLPDPLSLLRESARILRPGGLLYLTTPNFNSLSRRLLGARWRVICKEHVCYFTPRLLTRLLRDAGFGRVRRATRNLDPHELRKLFGAADAEARAGFQIERTEALRVRFERNPTLKVLKGAANLLLAATASGDTIIVRAEKAGAERGRAI